MYSHAVPSDTSVEKKQKHAGLYVLPDHHMLLDDLCAKNRTERDRSGSQD